MTNIYLDYFSLLVVQYSEHTLLAAAWAFLGGAEDLVGASAGGGALAAGFFSPPAPFLPESSTLSADSFIW